VIRANHWILGNVDLEDNSTDQVDMPDISSEYDTYMLELSIWKYQQNISEHKIDSIKVSEMKSILDTSRTHKHSMEEESVSHCLTSYQDYGESVGQKKD
jgi:hypothetical protein